MIGAPYSGVGVTKTVRTLPDGNRILATQSQKYFRDAQGRTRSERELLDRTSRESEQSQLIEVQDPVGRKRFVLFPHRRSVSTGLNFDRDSWFPKLQPPVSAPDPESLHAYPPIGLGNGLEMVLLQDSYDSGAEIKRTSLGEKIIDGVRATGTRAEMRLAASETGHARPVEISTEAWFSSDLGVVIRITHINSLGLEVTYRLEQLQLNEPDAALFEVPSDYTPEMNRVPIIQPRPPAVNSP